ncbi:N-acetylglucosamine-1-phosphodiester alpha-N-acetylglucosaminidase-like [Saccostrea cucullata]|uniref:N-acetylglucosamine-1-phosphodiester alpha-N-acetylglucosaminidase-like n=1 Tax=Saccostrea cuccullata TaxID=36930 RepID=UPI002ED3EEC9
MFFKVCPPGSYGVNCSEDCPKGFYGRFCEENCTCTDTCDKQYGCVETTSERNLVVSHDQEKTPSISFFSSVFIIMLVISVVGIVICFLAIFSTTVYFVKRSRVTRWSIYACTAAAQEMQQEDYGVILTNRTDQP